MRARWLGTAAVALALALGCATPATAGSEHDPQRTERVRVGTGWLKGVVGSDHRLFQGIPYAAPPVGDLRWKSPRPPRPWAKVRSAEKPGAICPQLPVAFGGRLSTDEDCLFLNVTTPKVSKGDRPRPVLVWIHGAGTIGSGDVFDARRLAATGDLVVVTINYRMGVFGAFGHPALKDSGTVGLQDQRAALKWVRRNIAAFGGDPRNVSLFGVSFGATAAAAHTLSPLSRGLFDKVIMHSGFPTMDAPAGAIYPFLGALPVYGWKSDADVRGLGTDMAKHFGCTGGDALACLRRIPAEKLLTYPRGMSIFQTYAYGNRELPGVPESLLRKGRFARVPVLAGATRDEHRTFVAIRAMTGSPIRNEDYPAVLRQAFGDHADEVESTYPLSRYENANVAFAAVMTDRMWAKATKEYVDLYSRGNPVYFYEFADRNPPEEFPFPPGLPSGAYHNADIDYLFRSPSFERRLTPAQLRLSDAMIGYWSAFARTGRPARGGLPAWPGYTTTGHVQSLAPDGIGPVDYAAEHRLPFWNRIAP